MRTPEISLVNVDDLELEDAKMLLRRQIRARRSERTPKESAAAATALAAKVVPLLKGVTTVALYASRPTEPGTAPLIAALHERGVEVLLPMLGPGLSRDWAKHAPGDHLEVRAPGRPPEADGPGLGEDAVRLADLVLAPALAVDDAGTRLGQGGGWYDRVLRHARPGVPIYAVVFDDEVLHLTLPHAEHDLPVHGVLTPSGAHLLADAA